MSFVIYSISAWEPLHMVQLMKTYGYRSGRSTLRLDCLGKKSRANIESRACSVSASTIVRGEVTSSKSTAYVSQSCY